MQATAWCGRTQQAETAVRIFNAESTIGCAQSLRVITFASGHEFKDDLLSYGNTLSFAGTAA